MPTVIDQFVVTLGLDPSNFTEGQRAMAANLRSMETNAQRSAQNIERSGSQIVAFFRTIDHPIASLRQHFERLATVTTTPQRNLLNLAEQGRRTGQEVEAGALQGAAGLRAMGVAGLTAVAAFVALDKLRSGAENRAAERFGVGVGAAGANLPIGQYTAISQALYETGLVPEIETQGFLSSVRSAQIQAQSGRPEAANALGVMLSLMNKTGDLTGINVYKNSNVEIMRAVAQQFKDVSDDTAIGLGNMIGWSKEFSHALHNLGAAGFDAAVAAANNTSETKEELDAQTELAKAHARMDVALQQLSWRIDEYVDPALSKFDDLITALAQTLSGVKPDALAMATSVPNSSQDAKPGFWRRALEWMGIIPTIGDTSTLPASTTTGANGAQTAAAPVPSGGTNGAASGGGDASNSFPPITNPTPSATSGNWEVLHNNFAGIRRAGIVAGPNQGGFESYATPEEGVQRIARLLQTYQDQHGLNTLRGIINRWAPPNENDTSSLISRAAQITGFSPDQPLNLHDAATLGLIVQAMIRGEQGGSLPVPGGVATINHALGVGQIRSIQLAQAGNSTVNHGDVNNDVDVNGGIHIYGADTRNGLQTGGAIADALHDQLHSQLLTNQINTGQQ